VLDDAAVLAGGALALCAAAGVFARRAANALVVDLGPARRPGLPITAQLGRALADPGLQLLYAVPGLGWMDERGRPSPPPERDDSLVTRAHAPGGGTVALVHSDDGAVDPRLAESAAAAAALALDAAHLEAEIRARSEEVRVSRRRLLTVADAERRSLEERLAEGVLAPLRHVDRLLASRHVDGLQPLREELDDALADVAALGHGLYPPALARADLPAALADLAARCAIPAAVTVHGRIGDLPPAQRAATWFVCAEALTNAARHANASRATVAVGVHADTLRLEIRDDGTGGATLTRGLRGLADRIEALGGTVTVTSPPGGPTSICAYLPL
jgi:signal transduction histidine kinase